MSRSTRLTRTAAIRRGIIDAQADIEFTEEFGHPPVRWEPTLGGPKESALYRKAYHHTVAKRVREAFQKMSTKAVAAARKFDLHGPDMSTAWPGDTDDEIQCLCGKATIAQHAHLEETMADTDGYPDLEPGELEAIEAEDLRKIPKTKEETHD